MSRRQPANKRVECANCGVKATCPKERQPANWVSITIDPPVLCCNHECATAWENAHPWSIQAWSEHYLEQFSKEAAS